MSERADALGAPVLVDVDDELHAGLARHAIPEVVHLRKLPGRIHMKQGEGRQCRMEGLLRQAQHDRTVLADRVQHDRLGERDRNLTYDVYGFRLKLVEMAEACLIRHGSLFCRFRF